MQSFILPTITLEMYTLRIARCSLVKTAFTPNNLPNLPNFTPQKNTSQYRERSMNALLLTLF